jgi:hypothetical protein
MSAVEQGASRVIQTKGMTMYSQSDYNTPLHNNVSDQAAAAAAGYILPGVEGGEFECPSKLFNSYCMRNFCEVGFSFPCWFI